jgi:phosphoenolpyruvate carboxykinase (GTP)
MSLANPMTIDHGISRVTNAYVTRWVDEIAALTKPKDIVWCDGSEAERARLTEQALRAGEIEILNQDKLPGCYLHRSHPNDVARTENLTFICTPTQEEAGPTNNWWAPREAYARVGEVLDGAMRDRTLYIVPFIMGPAGSPASRVGIQITDSIYVVLNLRIMTRMGKVAWDQLAGSDDFTRCVHSKADLDISRRFICHFPQDNTIWSVGSAYGGNALLNKKCFALRLASYYGLREGWMAEHMLILGVEDPEGRVTYVTGAFPSACGKTNLAMLVPALSSKGYKVWTVGDDIAWLRIGEDGRLWAINPEAGFFGVVPGTNRKSNPNAMSTIQRNTFYTNVLRRPDGTVWWEGHDDPPPGEGIDWRGRRWTPTSGEKAAHPNARFTAPASQCPSLSAQWENPKGVPISAMIFGARRTRMVPLVYEAFNWQHGTFVGATMASETTAAQAGAVGVLRRDPMAMLPFCGYHVGDYFSHWLSMGRKLKHPPRIFHVNWFRQGADGKFLWPGYGENIRVLRWILERASGNGQAVETPVGFVPASDALNLDGTHVTREAMRDLLYVDRAGWLEEVQGIASFFGTLGGRLPRELSGELESLRARLSR